MYSGIAVLGWSVVFYVGCRILQMLLNILYPYYIAKPVKLKEAAGGKWAVVTGSTDGIGRSYAFELARNGFSIVLISRTQTKLDQVRAEIELATNAEVKTVAYDFAQSNVENFKKKILEVLKDLEVGILVNNVGSGFHHPDIFHKLPGGLQKMSDVMTVNMLSTTLLTAGLLPQMVERKSGIIVNISSATSIKQMRVSSVYSATKRYITWLSRMLQREYGNMNIIIQVLHPMVVSTKMTNSITKYHPSIFNVNVDEFVRSAVRTIGITNETSGCALHQFQVELIKSMPDFIVDSYFGALTSRVRAAVMAEQVQKAHQPKLD